MIKEYLEEKLAEEADILTEILRVDNAICISHVTIDDLKDLLNNVSFIPQLNKEYDFLSDGTISNTLTVFCNFAYNIKRIHVNSLFAGLYTWVIEKLKEYDFNINITLDYEDTYHNYNDPLVIVGNKVFLEETKKLFKQEVILIEPSTING